MLLALASQVLPLSAETFSEVKSPSFIKFYAPWCGHCKQLAPIYAEFAEEAEISAYEVDCTVDAELCNMQGVTGFPTIKFYYEDQIYNFEGERTVDDLKEFADRMMRPALGKTDKCIEGSPCFVIETNEPEADEAFFSFIKQGYNYEVTEGPFMVTANVDGEQFSITNKATIRQFFGEYKNGFLPEFSRDLFEELAMQKQKFAVVILSNREERQPYIDVLKQNKREVITACMIADEWEQFIELFKVTNTPHALFLDFTSGERFFSEPIASAAELQGFVRRVLAGEVPEYRLPVPGAAERKTSSIMLAVAVGIVVFGGIAFALRCLKGQAASEVNIGQAERPAVVKEVSEPTGEPAIEPAAEPAEEAINQHTAGEIEQETDKKND